MRTVPRDPKPPSYQLYFVVPNDPDKFTPERRKELGVQGDFVDGLRTSKEFSKSKGYFAWLAAEQAQKITAATDVKTVHKMGADDVAVSGKPEKDHAVLMVLPVPNRWHNKPAEGTYLSVADLAAKWSKQFADLKGVRVSALEAVGQVRITFDGGQQPEKVLESLKADPQVNTLQWSAR